MLPPAGQTEKHLSEDPERPAEPPPTLPRQVPSSPPSLTYLFYLFLLFETGMYIALVGLERALSTRLARLPVSVSWD